MASRGDPVRWLHPDSDIPAELRSVLSSARTDGGGQDALASLAAKLPVATAAKVPVSAALGASKKAILSWKLAAWVAGAAALSGAASNLVALSPAAHPPAIEVIEARTSGAHSSSAPERAVLPREADKQEESASPPEGGGAGERAAEEASPARPESPSQPASSGQPERRGHEAAAAPHKMEAQPALAAKGPLPATSADSLAAEAKMLLQAREAMERDPAKALRTAEDHGTAFSDGALAEEREVLRVEALVRLGKHDEAAAAAAAFRARHPQSSHLARIDRLLRTAK